MKFHNLILIFLLSLSINCCFSNISNSNDLNGFNRLTLKNIFGFGRIKESKFDNIKLLGVSNLKKKIAIIEINNSIFEIILGKEKFGYKLIKISGYSATLKKNDKEYIFNLGDPSKSINVINPIFTSNLKLLNNSRSYSSNNEAIKKEQQNFKKSVEEEINFNQKLTSFEKSIALELVKTPSRSGAGRLGFQIPSTITGQSVIQFGLKAGDVILSINNIPIGNVNDIYSIYKDNKIKKYDVEVMRTKKLINIEWYK